MKWTRPAMMIPTLYDEMTKQNHILVAGMSGSGKSVAINGMIHALLHNFPDKMNLILIDPKGVELVQYKNLPHTITHAISQADMIAALQKGLDITLRRFNEMQRKKQRKYDGGHLWIIIDELADLMTTCRKAVLPIIQRICQLGRAANVHIVAATQCPLARVIPTEIKVNFDAVLGLHTRSAQDSRNIIGRTGLETLPRYGRGIWLVPAGIYTTVIHYTEEQELDRVVSWWNRQRPLFWRAYA